MPKANFPELTLTKEEFLTLTAGETLGENDLKYVPIGFRFKCRGDHEVIGVVVKGMDAITEQFGAGLSIPERFVNRYRAKIVG